MKRQLLTLCAAGLLAIPSLAETYSVGSTQTDSTSIGITSSVINSTTNDPTTSTPDVTFGQDPTAVYTDATTEYLDRTYGSDMPADQPSTVYDVNTSADTSGNVYDTGTPTEDSATVYDIDNSTDTTRYNYDLSAGSSPNTQSWDSWMSPADHAAFDLYFSTLDDSERALVKTRLSNLSASDQRAFIDLMNNMHGIDRDLWSRALNNYSPENFPPEASPSNVADYEGDTAFTSDISTDSETNYYVTQPDPDHWFGSFGPVDRTMADQMWVRLSDDERALLTRVMESDAATNTGGEDDSTGLSGSLFN